MNSLKLMVVTAYLSVTCGVLLSVPSFAGYSQDGDVRIIVKDENGTPIANAPVYLFNGSKMFYAESGAAGDASLALKAGDYRVSAALSVPGIQGTERFASLEAHVKIMPSDSTSLVLTLYPVEARIEELSNATLKKIGVSDEISKLLN